MLDGHLHELLVYSFTWRRLPSIFRRILEGSPFGLILRPSIVEPLQYFLARHVSQVDQILNHSVLHPKMEHTHTHTPSEAMWYKS